MRVSARVRVSRLRVCVGTVQRLPAGPPPTSVTTAVVFTSLLSSTVHILPFLSGKASQAHTQRAGHLSMAGRP